MGESNNQAELLAVREALQFIVAQGWKHSGDYILVKGDSQLAMKFLTREWTPRNALLFEIVDSIR